MAGGGYAVLVLREHADSVRSTIAAYAKIDDDPGSVAYWTARLDEIEAAIAALTESAVTG